MLRILQHAGLLGEHADAWTLHYLLLVMHAQGSPNRPEPVRLPRLPV
jgi:hypothetical protein